MTAYTDVVLHDTLRLVAAYPNYAAAGVAAGVSASCIQRRVTQAKLRGIALDTLVDPPSAVPQPIAPPSAPPEPPADPLVLRRLRAKCEEATVKLRQAEERAIAAEDERDRLLLIRNTPLAPLTWLAAPAVTKRTQLTPMLFGSDWHVGEVIRPEELDGLNEYNQDVFAARYQTMIDSAIDLAKNHTGASDFPGFYYLRGGDLISGGIHEELAETDDLTAVPAIRHLIRHEREAIKQLKSHFQRVRIVTVPGNHGRTTHKPRSKQYVERSWETLLAHWLEMLFDGDPDVEFETPQSGEAFFSVEGWKVLMAHGDRMGTGGGQGFIGPGAPILRGQSKLYSAWAASGMAPDVILSGHYHTSMYTGLGYANGSLIGYSQYSQRFQARPSAPSQWMLFAHRERCISSAFEVKVSERPRRAVAG